MKNIGEGFCDPGYDDQHGMDAFQITRLGYSKQSHHDFQLFKRESMADLATQFLLTRGFSYKQIHDMRLLECGSTRLFALLKRARFFQWHFTCAQTAPKFLRPAARPCKIQAAHDGERRYVC